MRPIDFDYAGSAMQGLCSALPLEKDLGAAARRQAQEERWARWQSALFAATASLVLWGAIVLGIRTLL